MMSQLINLKSFVDSVLDYQNILNGNFVLVKKSFDPNEVFVALWKTFMPHLREGY